MTASLLISIEASGSIDSHHIQLDARGAEQIRATLIRCQGLMPAEAAGRLADAILALEGVTVTKIDTSAIPAELAPADPASIEPPPPLQPGDQGATTDENLAPATPTVPPGQPVEGVDGAPV